MKVLFVDSRDHPAAFKGERCDWMIDLGWAPQSTYEAWARQFSCRVDSLQQYQAFEADTDFYRCIAAKGAHLIDQENIDWWQLFLLYFTEQIRQISGLMRLSERLNKNDQIVFARQCFEAQVIAHLQGSPPRILKHDFINRSIGHYLHELWALPAWQIRQIFWDKYDPAFALRHKFMRARVAAKFPQILAPSTYVNTSKMAMDFATALPEHHFLLVTTRASGNVSVMPANASSASIGCYASKPDFAQEYESLINAWGKFSNDLIRDSETEIMHALNVFAGFPKFLKQGLGVRNAWQRVFERESIEGIVCCDNNPFALLTVLLGQKRGIPTVSCHHGALDWRYGVLDEYADVVLAKGKMEQDYLVRVCKMPAEKVQVGTPAIRNVAISRKKSDSKQALVFFSEPYEGHGARAEEIYKSAIRALADLAIKTGRTLLIKLHPFENLRQRGMLIKKILSPEQQQVVQVIAGALTSELLARSWAGVTVLSTAALDCAAAGVPCFLCEWLQYPHHGYGEQFVRFHAGYPLQSANDISSIPEVVRLHPQDSSASTALWQPILSADLKSLFSSNERAKTVATV